MYCIKLINLDPARLEKVKWIIDQGIVNENVWLAGGSLRTLVDPKETIVDYDLFFRDVRVYNTPIIITHKGLNVSNIYVEETKRKLINLGYRLTFECPEGKMYSYTKYKYLGVDEFEIVYKVQLICEHFYSSPEELLATFDLTPTLFCTDGKNLWCYKNGIKAVKNKQCDLHKLTYPFSTFKRIMKYGNKGYDCHLAINKFISNLVARQDILTENEMRMYID